MHLQTYSIELDFSSRINVTYCTHSILNLTFFLFSLDIVPHQTRENSHILCDNCTMFLQMDDLFDLLMVVQYVPIFFLVNNVATE